MAYSVSLAKQGLLSAGLQLKISIVYVCRSRFNAMDSTRDSSVASPFPTVLSRIVHIEFFNRVINYCTNDVVRSRGMGCENC